MPMYDTIIIGAGMSGLAAGIRLAHYDQKVCILERHNTIGGLNSFYRANNRNYDVGLHAITNYTPKGTKKGPLARLLRQLRLRWDELELVPQIGSAIAFPNNKLRFTNDFEFFRSEVEREFPDQIDNFNRLLELVSDFDDLDFDTADRSSREVLNEYITDPLLIEMLFCPLMYYGSARENDMDFGQFSIMFRSIFMEGFARPYVGVRLILKKLVKKFRGLGGELKLRQGVSEIKTEKDRVIGVVLDDGTELEGRNVLSSAGIAETARMCNAPEIYQPASGKLSFIETISSLDKMPADLGMNETIVFYNDSDKFHYEKPAGDVDIRSGVICSPNNYQYDEPLEEGVVRITSLANYDSWSQMEESKYRVSKLHWYDQSVESAIRFVPDFRHHVVATDMFTPKTIHRYTWHDNGAVYGAPKKRYDGTTHLNNLFICGTDQGFLGIVGAIISGISMANMHCLKTD